MLAYDGAHVLEVNLNLGLVVERNVAVTKLGVVLLVHPKKAVSQY